MESFNVLSKRYSWLFLVERGMSFQKTRRVAEVWTSWTSWRAVQQPELILGRRSERIFTWGQLMQFRVTAVSHFCCCLRRTQCWRCTSRGHRVALGFFIPLEGFMQFWLVALDTHKKLIPCSSKLSTCLLLPQHTTDISRQTVKNERQEPSLWWFELSFS